MNTIKLKDVVHPTDQYFNEHLKGKYAWWVRLHWIVPFDIMTDEQYAQAEQVPDEALRGMITTGWYHIFDILDYVDDSATNCANDMSGFKTFNKFTPDSDITIDELKKFRTWLASALVELGESDPDTCAMLKYYAGGMVDPATELISLMAPWQSNSTSVPQASVCTCGCTSSSTLTQLFAEPNTCDPLSMYKMCMYNKMVEVFSQISYWEAKPKDLLIEFKHYIDNMLQVGLIPEDQTQNVIAKYLDCTCVGVSATSANKALMERLSQALDYIINCQISSHRNFIADNLQDWAAILYEKMEWN